MNAIVTTTINPPTEAIKRFAAMKDWKLYIVGDQKTPHEKYLLNDYPGYLSPEKQEAIDKDLSDYIGWNCVQRRTMGIVQAYRDGAEIIATVDDDNIPNDVWDVVPEKNTSVILWESQNGVFDPLSVTDHHELWHRGYPLQLVHSKNNVRQIGYDKRKPVVWANLWDGAPDLDAICRALYPGSYKLNLNRVLSAYASHQISPFNSQNTKIAREAIPYYYLFPKVPKRMDDIIASYVLQKYFPDGVVYGPPNVFQKRNPHSLVGDMQQEAYFFDPHAIRDMAEKIDEKYCELYKKALG